MKSNADSYVDRIYRAHMSARKNALSYITEQLPSLLNDHKNVLVCQGQQDGCGLQEFEIQYKGVKVAKFFVSQIESDDHIISVCVDGLEILYTDEELKQL